MLQVRCQLLRSPCHTPSVPAEGQGAPAEALSAQPEAQVPGVLRPDIGQHLQQSGLDTNSAAYRAAVRIQSRFRGFAVRKVRLDWFSASIGHWTRAFGAVSVMVVCLATCCCHCPC